MSDHRGKSPRFSRHISSAHASVSPIPNPVKLDRASRGSPDGAKEARLRISTGDNDSSNICRTRSTTMILEHALPFAAIGYSLLYLLFGGGLGGAVIIFIVAKMLGK